MPLQIQTIDRTKLSDSIVDQIVDAIRTGGLTPGASIPAERSLAAQFGVSRSSVREAIRVLEHAGVLEVRTGSGTYVTDASLSKAVMLRAHAALAGQASPLDLIVARRALEPFTAEIAAINRTRSDIETMRRALSEHAAALEGGRDPEEVDFSFHLALAAGTHNPVLFELVERVVELMRQRMWRTLKHHARERTGAVLFLDQHRAVLSAVERSDAREASHAMRAHLDAIETGLLTEVEQSTLDHDPTNTRSIPET